MFGIAFALNLVLQPYTLDDWTYVPMTNPPLDYPPKIEVPGMENRTGATITFSWNSFTVNLPQSVSGSSNNSPPWSAGFGTLNSTPVQFSVAGGSCPLADGYRIQYEVYYSSQTSYDKWTNGTQSPMRTKVTPTYIRSGWYTYPLDAPVGGGGGGTGG
jgi:hypothetical protein